MKILLLLLAAFGFASASHAAPMLVVDATLTEEHPDGSKDVWHADPLKTSSGLIAVMKSGSRTWTVTPTLKGSTVVVPMKLTRHQGNREVVESQAQVALLLGKSAELTVGNLTFAIKVTRAE